MKNSENASQRKILVVEDDIGSEPMIRAMIQKINPQSEIDWVSSAEEALNLIQAKKMLAAFDPENKPSGTYDLVLADIHLAGEKDGYAFARECVIRYEADFVLTSGSRPIGNPFPFIKKPFSINQVLTTLEPYLNPNALSPLARVRLGKTREAIHQKTSPTREWLYASVIALLTTWVVGTMADAYDVKKESRLEEPNSTAAAASQK